jgi:hypothetical protein
MLLIERERIQRFREQQRKVVQFGVEEEPGSGEAAEPSTGGAEAEGKVAE